MVFIRCDLVRDSWTYSMEGGSHHVRTQGELTAMAEKDVVQTRTCLMKSSYWRYFWFLTLSLHVRNSSFSFLELCFKQVVVDGRESSTVLRNLMSLTEYQIAVFAIYAHTASEGLRGTETTRAY